MRSSYPISSPSGGKPRAWRRALADGGSSKFLIGDTDEYR
jgi:hypothetical protein